MPLRQSGNSRLPSLLNKQAQGYHAFAAGPGFYRGLQPVPPRSPLHRHACKPSGGRSVRFQAVLQLLYEISSPLTIPRYRTHLLLLCRLSCGRGPDSTDSQVLPGRSAEPAAIPWSPRPTGPVISSYPEEGPRRHQQGALDSGRCAKDEIAHNRPNPRLDPQHPVPATTLIWAIAATAFWLFRLGELLVESPAHFSLTTSLSWGDVAVDSRTPPSMVKLRLHYSKCDQFGKGVDIVVGCTDTPSWLSWTTSDFAKIILEHSSGWRMAPQPPRAGSLANSGESSLPFVSPRVIMPATASGLGRPREEWRIP